MSFAVFCCDFPTWAFFFPAVTVTPKHAKLRGKHDEPGQPILYISTSPPPTPRIHNFHKINMLQLQLLAVVALSSSKTGERSLMEKQEDRCIPRNAGYL